MDRMERRPQVRLKRIVLRAAAATGLAAAATGCGASIAPSTSATKRTGGSATGAAVVTSAPTKPLASATWWVFYRPPLSLDPIKNEDYPENTILGNLCEPLLTVTPNFQVVPDLASAVNSSNPAKWVFTIRSGVRFWDGTPMTADDVVYSLERNLVPANASVFGATDLTEVAKIAKTAPNQVTITLKHPDVGFGERLVTGASSVVSESYAKRLGSRFGTPNGGIMCTGPYKLVSWDGATQLVVARNPNYWNTAAEPKLGRLTFVWPQDPGIVANSFLSGEFDGGFNLPWSAVSRLQSSSSGTLSVGNASQTLMVELLAFINPQGTAAADPRVRQALNLAIDRGALVQSVFNGMAAPAYSLAPQGTWGYAQNVFRAAYDQIPAQRNLAEAKRLVKAAGAVARKPITIATPAGQPLSTDQIAIIQQDAQQIGLTVRIDAIPAEQYGALFSSPQARKDITALLTIGYNHVQDPLADYEDSLSPSGIANYDRYDNPAIDKLIAQAQATADPTARANLVVQIQNQFLKDLPDLPILSPYTTLYQSSRITGAPITYTYENTAWAARLGGR